MENEELQSVDQEAVEQNSVTEETSTTEELPETTETVVQPSNDEVIEILNQMQETQLYSFGVQFLIFGLMFFVLFFTGMKAGKD
ncbi:MAG: hypothetical protein E6778_23380 [Niallia nealsonii]|nr:hypothetical protein [Niallia nealsonii]